MREKFWLENMKERTRFEDLDYSGLKQIKWKHVDRGGGGGNWVVWKNVTVKGGKKKIEK
jgi:hypothetical protein